MTFRRAEVSIAFGQQDTDTVHRAPVPAMVHEGLTLAITPAGATRDTTTGQIEIAPGKGYFISLLPPGFKLPGPPFKTEAQAQDAIARILARSELVSWLDPLSFRWPDDPDWKERVLATLDGITFNRDPKLVWLDWRKVIAREAAEDLNRELDP